MPDITSRQHPVVSAFKSAARGDDGRILLDGWHLVHDAVDAGLDFVSVAVLASPPSAAADALLVERLARHCDVFTVTSAVMAAISPVRTPSGVVAIAHPPAVTFADMLHPSPALVVVGCDVQDPGNVGAAIRSAEAGGATGVLMAGASADPWSWKSLRSAMGSTFRVPVLRLRDTVGALADLSRAGVTLVATVPRGGTAMYDVDLTRPTAFILGGEGSGLPQDVTDLAHTRLSVPMREPVESLNVGVTAALLVYEAARQRAA